MWQKKARAQREKAKQREKELQRMGLDPGKVNLRADPMMPGEQNWASIAGLPRMEPGDDLWEEA